MSNLKANENEAVAEGRNESLPLARSDTDSDSPDVIERDVAVAVSPEVTELSKLPAIFAQLCKCQKCFEKACNQIKVMEQQIRDLETRYKRAVHAKKHSFRYNLRLKLSVLTGVKMMYHHYAATKNDEIRRICNQLAELSPGYQLT